MSRITLVLGLLALAVGVSLYIFIEKNTTAIGIILAGSGISVFWNVVMTAWEKRQGEID